MYLEGNAISSLPEELFDCLPNLRWLDLRNNRISEIPPIIGKHRFDSHSLVILSLSNWLEQSKAGNYYSFLCQSTLHVRLTTNVSGIDWVFLTLFSNRNLKNLLLEGNTIESLPLELGEYV